MYMYILNICLYVWGHQLRILEWLIKTMISKLGRPRTVEYLLLKDNHSKMNCLHKVCISKGSDIFMFLLENKNLEALGFEVVRVPQLCRDLLR